ncbi:MAG: glycosyltransferase family 2 protein [Candidatus Sericytochromatia bacterium]
MIVQRPLALSQPAVSVVIPAYAQPKQLKRCLDSLREQRFADFEIWVVDDGSPDPLWAESLYRHWPRLGWLRLPHNQGRAVARNQGWQQARGEWVVFLDSDMAVSPDFVQTHWEFQHRQGPRWIGQGRIIGTSEPDARPHPSVWTDASRAFFATGNVCVAQRALRDAGGFDPDFSTYGWEDLELGWRLRQMGWRSAPVPQACSWHLEPPPQPTDWERDCHKERERGRGGAHFYAKHPHWEVALMTQLSPVNHLLDQLLGLGKPAVQAYWFKQIERMQARYPKLALALYRGLLSHESLISAQKTHAENKRPG